MKDFIYNLSGSLLLLTIIFDIYKMFVLIWSFSIYDLRQVLTATLICFILYHINEETR
jgi:NADH:ubiquinone oxidoreductase subunit 3 (subunit A)